MTPRRDDGFATAEYVVACGLGLVLLVLVANLLVDVYARAVVRDAVDEAARAAVPIDAPAGACEARAAEILRGLLGGPAGDRVTLTCSPGPDWVVVTADVTLPAWLPALVPDWHFRVQAVTAKERA